MALRRTSEAQGKTVSSRLCPTCGRETDHEITEMPGVGGVRIAARSKCLEHREWTGGQIEFLQADGEWSTDRPT